ncbi:3-oxo-tetronate kinase [Nitratireductor sp. ZSWI3]|uniref:3-oxo-tetronate kinase n=1 Tax=Nitratireductor sp. ZSWI3 TaxID=2966359 RepID=UPI00214F7A8A|nr:3-oxo-tetronate kinase [Nitratireductor sp. ZSWI3]MCR4265195.1 four-carbon acid sugar kinase family protein [Nitratireductor sp. ZSWI3]
MLLGVIADDFTGASDISNAIARGASSLGGLRVAQFMEVPGVDAPIGIEAGVISLKSRSIEPREAVRQSLEAFEWLRRQGCEQVYFKYCSTFDSSPEGNIGPVGEALADELGVHGVVVCPTFPKLGRTVYQGHLFVGDRLLNQSGMENHPLTPMPDADIRRWLSLQSKAPVGLASLQVVRSGEELLRIALEKAARQGEKLVIVDAVSDEDLEIIARACVGAPLVTGGSALAAGLSSNLVSRREGVKEHYCFHGIDGPEAILSGSCSAVTRKQIAYHSRSHPALAIDVESVMTGEVDAAALLQFLKSNEGRAPLVYSSSEPEAVSAAQAKWGRENVALKLDQLFASLACALVDGGTRRLIVAGGETSGAVARALNLGALEIGPEIDPGVPILINESRTVGLALKSGNFGSEQFFTKALERMRGQG